MEAKKTIKLSDKNLKMLEVMSKHRLRMLDRMGNVLLKGIEEAKEESK